jgi:hypothetical protein
MSEHWASPVLQRPVGLESVSVLPGAMSHSPAESLESLPSGSSSSSSSAFSSPSSGYSDLPTVVPRISKREYLLAQIRQKDAIIESLLKQVFLRVVSLIV